MDNGQEERIVVYVLRIIGVITILAGAILLTWGIFMSIAAEALIPVRNWSHKCWGLLANGSVAIYGVIFYRMAKTFGAMIAR